ncbi:hypothetical protein EIN_179110 [Entamoeba invadens IP1]|uniref:hypothetical protein n=1 Tax=Entamoeba invadens IP1 TaxID=370355 RepID=UPI0002C3F003|nr:hypothetical protein EIN_179110 [Entamoeba invadens IP1]ELP93924.1 hypothetical protein EIN_179110 [Entamoeba invadens IP1]|eukprot:XP_004260695.1 hypothetical protein EIN_179110 [Entamoeba invadens IP1]
MSNWLESLKQLSFDSWAVMILWGTLCMCEVILFGFSIGSFFVLTDSVLSFKHENDKNFQLPDIFSLPSEQLTPCENNTDLFTPIASYYETYLLNYLHSQGIFKNRCIPNITFDKTQIKECVSTYCNANNDDSECALFFNTNGTNFIPALLAHLPTCHVNLSFENKKGEVYDSLQIKITPKPDSLVFTSSFTEVKRLLLIYNTPLFITFDKSTIRPMHRCDENENAAPDYMNTNALTKNGKYLATPTLQPTGVFQNSLVVGWNDDTLGFVLKEAFGHSFGHSKLFWVGERSQWEDIGACGGDGIDYWIPLNTQKYPAESFDESTTRSTKLRVREEVCRKYYNNNCSLDTNSIYYVYIDDTGVPMFECVNIVFGMYNLGVVRISKENNTTQWEYTTIMGFTIAMMENMFEPELPILTDKADGDCGFSFMTYAVLRNLFELHEASKTSPVVCVSYSC